jgi:hypothetical protein
MTKNELERASRDELEALYRDAPLGPAPSGCYRGKMLTWLDTPGAHRWHVRVADSLLFRALPFGVDFDRNLWWFVRPRLRAGRFRTSVGPSRWREAETLRLEYDVSRLPWPVPRLLYDEVKPLAEGLCLGLGGMNFERGEGDHFFFALWR